MKTLVRRAPRGFLIPTALALLFAMNTHAATDKIVYDFQNATNATAWQVVNDDVMGGVSTSSFCLTNDVALFQGKVSLENNGGFASARSLPARHDLGGVGGPNDPKAIPVHRLVGHGGRQHDEPAAFGGHHFQHILHRRRFEKDVRRHFVGEVETYEQVVARAWV